VTATISPSSEKIASGAAKHPVESVGQITRRRLLGAEKLENQGLLAAETGPRKVPALAGGELRLPRFDQGVVKQQPIGARAGFVRHRSLMVVF
jgi:hypothetical protein